MFRTFSSPGSAASRVSQIRQFGAQFLSVALQHLLDLRDDRRFRIRLLDAEAPSQHVDQGVEPPLSVRTTERGLRARQHRRLRSAGEAPAGDVTCRFPGRRPERPCAPDPSGSARSNPAGSAARVRDPRSSSGRVRVPRRVGSRRRTRRAAPRPVSGSPFPSGPACRGSAFGSIPST